MKLFINKKINDKLKLNEINILIECRKEEDIDDLIEYLNHYQEKVLVIDEGFIRSIEYKDVICFFSDNKYNYCMTKNKNYKINHKLYELEEVRKEFIRISKKCIINVNHLQCFDKSINRKNCCNIGQWNRRKSF